MKLSLCPHCRTIHEVVGPGGLTELSEEGRSRRLRCALCSTRSVEFRQVADAPDTAPGEFGYPAAVTCAFEVQFKHWANASTGDLILASQDGLPFYQLTRLARGLRVDGVTLGQWVNLEPDAIPAGIRAWASLHAERTEVLLFIASLAGRIELAQNTAGARLAMDPGLWMSTWLRKPNKELDGRLPEDFLCTQSRREVLNDLVAQAVQRGYG
jgi:hypothetical protein